jgi:gentisate 1,2-dioxygenase
MKMSDSKHQRHYHEHDHHDDDHGSELHSHAHEERTHSTAPAPHHHSHGQPTGNAIERVGFTRDEFMRLVLTGMATAAASASGSASAQGQTVTAKPRSDSYDDKVVFHQLSPYREFLKKEGIPVYEGGFIDVNQVELKPWKRVGALGAYIFLEGTAGTVDAWVAQLPPGTQTIPERHIFEEQILVLSGKGQTQVWQKDPKNMVTVEWEKGALFPTPLNTWHRHINKGKDPARIAAITNAPLLIDMYRHTDFIFNNDYVFTERFDGRKDYFSPNGTGFYPTEKGKHHTYTVVNYVPNVWKCELLPAGQGIDDLDNHFAMARNTMASHVEQFPVGTYERAHRHGPGSTIILLDGTGYSLMWPREMGTTPFKDGKDSQVTNADWKEGTLVIPPLQWYHQHFNSGKAPARFVKLGGWNNDLYPFSTTLVSDPARVEIDYKDEDPKVRSIFAERLAKAGGRMKMPEIKK